MSRVFISYRRADSPDAVGRICDHLIAKLGDESVFKDVDSIPPGEDFRSSISDAIAKCEAFVVVIGPDWQERDAETNNLRINDPNDFVHIELLNAFAQGTKIVPVLVRGAAMPAPDCLPEPLRRLSYLNALQIRPDPDFKSDVSRLSDLLLGEGRVKDRRLGATWELRTRTRKAPGCTLTVGVSFCVVLLALCLIKLANTPIARPNQSVFDLVSVPNETEFKVEEEGVELSLESASSDLVEFTFPFEEPDEPSIEFPEVRIDLKAISRNPGVEKFDQILVGEPTIVHLRNWRYVTKADFAKNKRLEGSELEREYAKAMKTVEAVHRSLKLILTKQSAVYVEGFTDNSVLQLPAEIRTLEGYHILLRTTGGIDADHEQSLLRLGAPVELFLDGKPIQILPAEEPDYERSNPLDGVIDDKRNVAREAAIVKRIVAKGESALLVLGGDHDLTAAVKAHSGWGYVRITPKGYPK